MLDSLPLPLGVTGFHAIENRLPQVNFADFKRACFGVALLMRARIVTFHSAEGQVDPNFHWAELQTSSGTVYMLCNAYLPWIAFVEADPQGAALQFSSKAQLAEAWTSSPEFLVLERAYLEAAPTSDIIQYLDPIEQHQIKSWKPKRIGDIIFNYWD